MGVAMAVILVIVACVVGGALLWTCIGGTLPFWSEGTESSTVESVPKTANELFLDKIDELEDAHGAASLNVTSPSEAGSPYVAYLLGLAYAQIVDFGDGEDCLVTVYCDGTASTDPSELGYIVEVWEYDEDSQSLSSVLPEEGGSYRLDLAEETQIEFVTADDATYLALDVARNYTATPVSAYYGLSESGSLGIVHELAREYISDWDIHFYIDGVETTMDEYYELRDDFLEPEDYTLYRLSQEYPTQDEAEAGDEPTDDGESYTCLYPADTMATVEKTRQLLVSRASDSEDSSEIGDETEGDQEADQESDEDADLGGGEGTAQEGGGYLDITGTEVTEDVELPSYSSGATSDGTFTATWGYLELSGSDINPLVAASLNTAFKDAFEQGRQSSQAWAPGGASGHCLRYRSILTCYRSGFWQRASRRASPTGGRTAGRRSRERFETRIPASCLTPGT